MLVEKVAELGCEQLIDHFLRSLGLHPSWRLLRSILYAAIYSPCRTRQLMKCVGLVAFPLRIFRPKAGFHKPLRFKSLH